MPRKGWVILVVLLLIPLLLAVGAYVRLRLVAREMERDVRALAATHVERRALEPVSPNGFEVRVWPLVRSQASRKPPPWKEAWITGKPGAVWVDVRNGVRPLSELPEEARLQLDQLRPWVLDLLAATHSERPAQPVERLANAGADGRGEAFQHAVRLAAVDQLLLIDEGRPGEALRRCVDSLALARDAGVGGTLVDAMFGSSMLAIVRHACARSIDAASTDEQRAALADLAVVRSGFSSAADWMRNEAVLQELWAAGFVSDDELDQLPGGAGASAKSSSPDAFSGPAAWAFALSGFSELKRRNQAAVVALALPKEQRAKALAELKGTFSATRQGDTADYEKFAERTDRRDLMLDQLQCMLELSLGRAGTGQWTPSAKCAPLTHVENDVATVTIVAAIGTDTPPAPLSEPVHAR